MRRWQRNTVLATCTALTALAAGLALSRSSVTAAASCTAEAGTARVSVTPEQAANAATIAAVGIRDGMPDHAVTVALATAFQESRLINLDGGDRDSAGLFQQRPSQGWGTHSQVTDPVYAADAFYRALRRLPDWRTAAVTEAAQAVQHSAAPAAYAAWETQARALAIGLTGEQGAVLTCAHLSYGATTPVAPVAQRELGTATVSGAQDAQHGWALASWLIGHASAFDVTSVSFGGESWTSATGRWQVTWAPVSTLSYQIGT